MGQTTFNCSPLNYKRCEEAINNITPLTAAYNGSDYGSLIVIIVVYYSRKNHPLIANIIYGPNCFGFSYSLPSQSEQNLGPISLQPRNQIVSEQQNSSAIIMLPEIGLHQFYSSSMNVLCVTENGRYQTYSVMHICLVTTNTGIMTEELFLKLSLKIATGPG